MRIDEFGDVVPTCSIVEGAAVGGAVVAGGSAALRALFPGDRSSQFVARIERLERAGAIREMTAALNEYLAFARAQARAQDTTRRAQQQIQSSFAEGEYDLAHQLPGRTPIGGTYIQDVPAQPDVLDALIGATKKQLKKSPLKAQAVAEFGSVKKAAQALKFREPALPTQVTLAGYGVIRPLIRGSRDDPAGALRPRRFLWPDSLIP